MTNDSKKTIYLDHNGTTPVDPEAARAMELVIRQGFGNPSCSYRLGIEAAEAHERHRAETAALIGASPDELVFTSGGSESNNSVIKGIRDLHTLGGAHMITTAIEHPAILNPMIYLMELGADITVLPVDKYSLVDPDDVRRALRPDTALISVMLANNETGTLEPVREIAAIAREHGIPMHTDAAQAVGKIPVDVEELGVDFLSVAGHKLYGPKGIGAIYIRKGKSLTPLIHGGGQEMGFRAGTENTILAAGLGTACRVAGEKLGQGAHSPEALRDRLQELLFEGIDGLVLNGHPEKRLPNTLNVCVPGLEGAAVLRGIPDVLASTGAACHDKNVRLSHVLSAMGVPPEIGMGALRFTVGRSNDMAQIEEAADRIINQVKTMRG